MEELGTGGGFSSQFFRRIREGGEGKGEVVNLAEESTAALRRDIRLYACRCVKNEDNESFSPLLFVLETTTAAAVEFLTLILGFISSFRKSSSIHPSIHPSIENRRNRNPSRVACSSLDVKVEQEYDSYCGKLTSNINN